ncbi:Abi family protein [Xanthomonas citri pv. malvacearum]|uniref:Abortive phage resistance protein n=1 Tax=Xanthomonas campestris pv. malvacearum TaxID=86040 RepID=A0AA44Z2L0_XANCM|nr:Abi family protein [Xanthomonas citri]ASY85574.1 abortive phage resistance protein [Xanthomonas citri pv. malvacearum]MCC4629167.1 Abi family protein [Xanthomonas citri]NMI13262.1 Abi family protein [Xanthomonas citri]PUE93212.1 abortive phage resistance protein [Xanthomonas citri pv. malvacearum]QGL17191.1 Abi family protein [Xanthomonas citri pv. malvacearum]
MSYQKSWKSYQEQLDQLKCRGMGVTDEPKALLYLERIGYYRLSGYWYPFRLRAKYIDLTESYERPEKLKVKSVATDVFLRGTLFSEVIELYVFDKRLRHLVGDALERIEVALRVDISHTLGKLDTFAYANPGLLHQKFATYYNPQKGGTAHEIWLSKNNQLVDRSKEDFVKHNKEKYGLPLAIWVVCEVWDFGALSVLYGGMREAEQDVIAKKYGIANGRIFATWLRSLNYLRNVCAHHSRLWNRNVDEQPRLPDVAEISWVAHFHTDRFARARCFMLLKMIRHLMMVINANSTWADRLRAHLESFPDLAKHGLGVSQMGAPTNWSEIWDQ